MNMNEYTMSVIGWVFHYFIHLAAFLGVMVFAGLLFGFEVSHDNIYKYIAGFVVLEILWCWYERDQHKKSTALIREWEEENNFKSEDK